MRESLFSDPAYQYLAGDAHEYMKAEIDALEEHQVDNPSKYSMSYDDFEAKHGKEPNPMPWIQNPVDEPKAVEKKPEPKKAAPKPAEPMQNQQKLYQQTQQQEKVAPAKPVAKKEAPKPAAPVSQPKVALAEQKQQLSAEVMTQISKMQDKADAFAKTLNMDDFQAVQESLTQLQKKHINAKEAIVNFDIVEQMREGFTEFPQMKNNEFVQEQLTYLEGAQDNLNNNPANG